MGQTGNATGPRLLLAGLPHEHHEIGLLLFALAAHEKGYGILPLGPNMPLSELPTVARKKDCHAIVLSGAIEPAKSVLVDDLPQLVAAVNVPVFVGGLSSVYACDAINRTGAEALGQDIDHGLARIGEVLS